MPEQKKVVLKINTDKRTIYPHEWERHTYCLNPSRAIEHGMLFRCDECERWNFVVATDGAWHRYKNRRVRWYHFNKKRIIRKYA